MAGCWHSSRFFLLLGCLWLAGCALPGFQPGGQAPPPPPEPYETAAERYRSLQQRLDTLPAGDPRRAPLERQAAATLAEFEELVLNRARGHERNHELLAATRLLEKALALAPSERLQSLYKALNERRLQELRLLAWRQEIADTRHLMDTTDILHMRARLAELSDEEKRMLAQADQRLEHAARSLRECAGDALDAGRPDIASRCADLAAALAGEAYVAGERARIREHLAATNSRAARKAEPVVPAGQREVQQLRLRLHLHVRQGELIEARDALRRLIEIEGETPQFKELRAAIDDAIAARVAELAERANAHYRKQEYAQARDAWRELLRYDPDNKEARAALERAEKILHKLEELKQQQQM